MITREQKIENTLEYQRKLELIKEQQKSLNLRKKLDRKIMENLFNKAMEIKKEWRESTEKGLSFPVVPSHSLAPLYY